MLILRSLELVYVLFALLFHYFRADVNVSSVVIEKPPGIDIIIDTVD